MPLKFADFALLRLSAESITKLDAVPGDEAALPAFIADHIASPNFLDALYLASPSLCSRLMLAAKPDIKTGRAVLKYLLRSCSRATPFGLFAGVMPIAVGDGHQLEISARQLKRVTRFDCYFLAAVQRFLVTKYRQLPSLLFRPADTLYLIGHHFRYIEAGQYAAGISVKLSEITHNDALQAVLDCSIHGASVADLCQQLQQQFVGIAPDEIKTFVLSVIEAGVLQPQLQVPLICSDLNQQFIRQLQALGQIAEADDLFAVSQALAQIDQYGFVDPDRYQQIYQQLTLVLPVVPQQKLLQVDCCYQLPASCYAKSIQSSVRRSIQYLAKYFGRKPALLASFVEQFQNRFRDRFIPLLQVLDDENGISWHKTHYDNTPIAGLKLQRATKQSESRFCPLQHLDSARQSVLRLDQLIADTELDLADIERDLPFSLAALVTLYKDTNGEDIIYLGGVQGPSAANWLGRFCHLNEQLLHQVRQLLQNEAAWSPEVIFAEVVHLPDDRQGNVICRPALREYYIPVMQPPTDSSGIELSDLFVFVEDSFVKLWSKRLGKQVVPRLSCAHNFVEHALGIYRFLGMLQHQYYNHPRCELPDYLDKIAHFPRLQYGNVILREEQWRINTKTLAGLMTSDQIDFTALRLLQQQTGLERYVCYMVHDNSLTIDLYNPVLLRLLIDEVKEQSSIVLKESLNHKFLSVVHATDGPYAHELLLPLENHVARQYKTIRPPQAADLENCSIRIDEATPCHISCVLYGAAKTLEQILLGSLVPILRGAQNERKLDYWYFQREERGKIGKSACRIYLYGELSQLLGTVLARLQEVLRPWQDGFRLTGFSVTPYAETIVLPAHFEVKQIAAIRQALAELIIFFLPGDAEYNIQDRLFKAFSILKLLMGDLFADSESVFNFVDGQRRKYSSFFKDDAVLRRVLGKDYAVFKRNLNDFADEYDGLQLSQQYLVLLDLLKKQVVHSQALGFHDANDVLVGYLSSYLINNLFFEKELEIRFVIFDYFRRFYLALMSDCRRSLTVSQ